MIVDRTGTEVRPLSGLERHAHTRAHDGGSAGPASAPHTGSRSDPRRPLAAPKPCRSDEQRGNDTQDDDEHDRDDDADPEICKVHVEPGMQLRLARDAERRQRRQQHRGDQRGDCNKHCDRRSAPRALGLEVVRP